MPVLFRRLIIAAIPAEPLVAGITLQAAAALKFISAITKKDHSNYVWLDFAPGKANSFQPSLTSHCCSSDLMA